MKQYFKSNTLRLAENVLRSVLDKNEDEVLTHVKNLFREIFGKNFSESIENNNLLRYKSLGGDKGNIPFLGFLYENAPQSGIYENFSLVLFPNKNTSQILLAYGIGTGGITDDAEWLSQPWVRRSIQLLLKLIEKHQWNVVDTKSFVKEDITDEVSSIPDVIKNHLGDFYDYDELWKKYGKFLPSVCVVEADENGAKAFLAHLLLYSNFRGWPLKKDYREILENIFSEILSIWQINPSIDKVKALLLQRKYIILQGPPGTGKTYMAQKIAKKLKEEGEIFDYKIIQFHPSISYEDFIEGIKPDTEANQLLFRKYKGPFIEAIENAKNGKGYLLIIDEVNRGDLGKILGEAIFLLEPNEEREIKLRSGRKVKMPKNLYIIGTMNTADRSLALLDYAIRRRFAFIDILPSSKELEKILKGQKLEETLIDKILKKYNSLNEIFFKYASEEEILLQPGHTYFIASSEEELKNRLRYEVKPLLKEYMQEGKLELAKNELLAFIKSLDVYEERN